ncbi:hypothetical protein ACP275_14G072600 [Erythranthe tilingii]
MYVYVKLIRFYCDNITIETFGRARQIGQVSWERSHRSMHSTWNSCPHNPSFLHSSPSSNELKHTTHSNRMEEMTEEWRPLLAETSHQYLRYQNTIAIKNKKKIAMYMIAPISINTMALIH